MAGVCRSSLESPLFPPLRLRHGGHLGPQRPVPMRSAYGISSVSMTPLRCCWILTRATLAGLSFLTNDTLKMASFIAYLFSGKKTPGHVLPEHGRTRRRRLAKPGSTSDRLRSKLCHMEIETSCSWMGIVRDRK